MFTAALILAALLVLTALIVVVGQMFGSGSMWFMHVVCDTPATLVKALCFLVTLAIEANKD